MGITDRDVVSSVFELQAVAIAIATLCGCATEPREGTPTSSTTDTAVADTGSSGGTDGSSSTSNPGSSSEGTFEGTFARGEDSSSSSDSSSSTGDLGEGSSTGTAQSSCRSVPSHDGLGDIRTLSDEFDDPASICGWTFRHEEEGEAAQFVLFDIDESNAGFATMIPTPSGWYDDWAGPLFYKQVYGDFIVDAWVRADSLTNPGHPPIHQFTSVGLLARNPNHGPAFENWVMVDLGYQAEVFGHEGKNTVESESELYTSAGAVEGQVRICRVGSVFRLARRFAGEATFVTVNEFVRDDLPAQLQVGAIINAWNGVNSSPNFTIEADLLATWDYVHFRPITSIDECALP